MYNIKMSWKKYIILLVILLPAGLNAQSNQRAVIFKMAQFFDWIGGNYVDTVNLNKLSDDAIRRTLQQLDPHSVYVTKDEVRAMNEPLEGSFDGIGVSFDILNDTLLITSPITGGPSEKVGIMAGDKIITIEGENIAGIGITTSDVHRRLRGRAGTNVTVGIHRRGHPELLSFRIVRDKIPIYSVNAAYKVTEKTGYIKLSRFSASSIREFDDALKKLKSEGITDLILDLTGNGGGYMHVAAQLANEFLERGQLIVFTEGDNSPRRDYRATSNGNFQKGKLVVMMDESSASAREILAGAVQDWDRGTIVGRRSFGKGLVQQQLMFADSSMLRLTVSRYHTPTGRVIQKPYNTNDDEYARGGARRSRLQTGELTADASEGNSDLQQYQTLVQKRTVYGGGGITPDVFVAMDTSFYTNYLVELIGKGIFNHFMLSYVDKNRQLLKQQYPTFKQFDQQFIVTDDMLEELQNFAEKEGLEKNPEMFAESKEYYKLRFKGYIARDIWETSEMHEVLNRGNPIFLKAVEVISTM